MRLPLTILLTLAPTAACASTSEAGSGPFVVPLLVHLEEVAVFSWTEPPPGASLWIENTGPGSLWISYPVASGETQRFELAEGHGESVVASTVAGFTLHHPEEGAGTFSWKTTPELGARVRVVVDGAR